MDWSCACFNQDNYSAVSKVSWTVYPTSMTIYTNTCSLSVALSWDDYPHWKTNQMEDSIVWDKASNEDLWRTMDHIHRLQNISLPDDIVHCTEPSCHNHQHDLDTHWKAICDCIVQSANECSYSCEFRHNLLYKGGKRGEEEGEKKKGEGKEAESLWREIQMSFHLQVCYCPRKTSGKVCGWFVQCRAIHHVVLFPGLAPLT